MDLKKGQIDRLLKKVESDDDLMFKTKFDGRIDDLLSKFDGRSSPKLDSVLSKIKSINL